MFDNRFQLFNVQLPGKDVKNQALVLNGCNAYFKNHKEVYSELEELSYVYLNNNDYNGYGIEVEFCFVNNLMKPYHWFYAGCFSIRTDNGVLIKLDGSRREKALAKISMSNQMVLGVGVFFRNNEECHKIKDSKEILIEGFFAIDKYTNTYAVSCKLEKKEGSWIVVFGNTYQMSSKDDIRNKLH